MDLVTGQRTYVIGVSGTYTTNESKIVEVPFKDTAGNVIECSYCKIQLGSSTQATTTTAAVLELSGLSRQGDMVTNGVSGFQSDTALANASGILGLGVCNGYLAANNVAEWHGSNGEVATGAKLQIHGNNNTYRLLLTYGNLYPLNSKKLDIYDRGV